MLQNSITARLVDLNWWLDEQMPFVPEKMQVGVGSSASKRSIRRFVITEKAPTRAFSWLKAAHSVPECGFEGLKTYQAPAHTWDLPR